MYTLEKQKVLHESIRKGQGEPRYAMRAEIIKHTERRCRVPMNVDACRDV